MDCCGHPVVPGKGCWQSYEVRLSCRVPGGIIIQVKVLKRFPGKQLDFVISFIVSVSLIQSQEVALAGRKQRLGNWYLFVEVVADFGSGVDKKLDGPQDAEGVRTNKAQRGC